MGELLQHRGLLRGLALDSLGGVLGKGGLHGIIIPRFEKDVVFAFPRVLFQRKINAIFFCHTFKGFDIFLRNINTFHARSLPDKLLYSLLAVMDFRILGLRHVLPHGPFEQIGGQSAAGLAHLDCQCYGFVPHFVLHDDLPPSCTKMFFPPPFLSQRVFLHRTLGRFLHDLPWASGHIPGHPVSLAVIFKSACPQTCSRF